jgi:hypothetical protein
MNTPIAVMVVRMKRLPRRHRIAHLRALLRRQSAGSIRGAELAALLRNEANFQGANRHGTRKT